MSRQGEKTIFFDLLELPPDQRDAYIESQCGQDPTLRMRVQSLLKAHIEAGEFLGNTDAGSLQPPINELSKSDSTPAPESIGPYRVLRTLGQGGFGTVYLCQQLEPIERQIAVKVLRPGMDTQTVLRRFEEERILLSKMDHPGIARVLDAGRTEHGLPYIAMEYVDGSMITTYCDRHRLDLNARLELFSQACLAIQHAHQKGVIHRDIKPSNVLVTEIDGKPLVKVIDFGVSKAIDSRDAEDSITRTMQLVGTPQYMSPEQASTADRDLDTRTDVYSLGVMLYELSTGMPPFDPDRLRSASIGHLERLIRDTDPVRPSTRVAKLIGAESDTVSMSRSTPIPSIIRQLRGEIDWIIARAMDTSRDRRYPSAFAFYEDIRRVLSGDIVHARPPSKAYAIRKLIARHKALTSVGVLMLLSIVGVSIISLLYASTIRRANSQIQSSLKTQEQVLVFTEQMLRGIDPSIARGKDTELFRTILDQASDRVHIELAKSPEVSVRVRLLIGESYRSIGMFDEALTQFKSAASIGSEELGKLDPQTLSARSALGTAYGELTQYQEAQSVLESAYADTRTAFGEHHPDTLVVLSNLVSVYNFMGDQHLAVNAAERLLDARIQTLGDQHNETMATRNTLALALKGLKENEQARTLFEQVLAYQIDHLGEDHPNTLKTRTNLAQAYQELGLLDRSIEMNNTILEQKIKVLGNKHPSVLVSMVNLAMVLEESGDTARALPLLTEALDISLETLGESHQYTLIIRNNLAKHYTKSGDFDQALPLMRLASEGMRSQLGDEHPMTIQSMGNLADLLIEMERFEEALDISLDIRVIAQKALDESDPALGMVNQRPGVCLLRLGREAEAEPYLRSAAEIYLKHDGPESERYLMVRSLIQQKQVGKNDD
ncbi:MAG: serine/threonine-protein kinase [Phycisphaerales bacterium]|nr:serine/threonine-protein kinase [Phycisphaerales bacterium]